MSTLRLLDITITAPFEEILGLKNMVSAFALPVMI